MDISKINANPTPEELAEYANHIADVIAKFPAKTEIGWNPVNGTLTVIRWTPWYSRPGRYHIGHHDNLSRSGAIRLFAYLTGLEITFDRSKG